MKLFRGIKRNKMLLGKIRSWHGSELPNQIEYASAVRMAYVMYVVLNQLTVDLKVIAVFSSVLVHDIRA